MTKNFLKYFLVVTVVISIILYISTIKESFENFNLEGSYLENIPKTLEYFVFWVLPFLWVYILIISIIIAFVIAIIKNRNQMKI